MNATPEFISLLDAAKATDKKKSTILRRIKHKDVSKRILAHQDDNGEWQVSLHSLSQHYRLTNDGMLHIEERHATGATLRGGANTEPRTTSATSSFATSNVKLEAELQLLSERISNRDETIVDLRADKGRLSDQVDQFAETINRQTLLITAREGDSNTSVQPTARKPSPMARVATATLLVAAAGAVAMAFAPDQVAALLAKLPPPQTSNLSNASMTTSSEPTHKASQMAILPQDAFLGMQGSNLRVSRPLGTYEAPITQSPLLSY